MSTKKVGKPCYVMNLVIMFCFYLLCLVQRIHGHAQKANFASI